MCVQEWKIHSERIKYSHFANGNEKKCATGFSWLIDKEIQGDIYYYSINVYFILNLGHFPEINFIHFQSKSPKAMFEL